MKPCIIVGIRPQFIHLFGLLVENALPEDIMIVNTNQHFDPSMNQSFHKELGLPQMFNLNVRTNNDFYDLAFFIKKHRVSKLYVIGDSRTTVMGAIAAKATNTELIHVEAGLRCDEFIPEEVNRRFVDAVSDVLWVPTGYALENLAHEKIKGTLQRTRNFRICAFKRLVKKVQSKHYDVVCEFHRQNNVDDSTRFNAIRNMLMRSKKTVFWSVHPRITSKYGPISSRGNLTVSKPLGYMEWLSILKGAKTVVTDSGGIQLEAYELNKRIVSLRSDVEWKHTMPRTALIGDNLDLLKDCLQ